MQGQKPSTELLNKLRAEYARNGRNIHGLSQSSGTSQPALRTYRDKYQWDAWADKLDTKTNEKALERGAKANADALEAASIALAKIREGIADVQVRGTSLRDYAIALEKLHKVTALLTGGDTERVDFSRYSDSELADELKRLGDKLRAD